MQNVTRRSFVSGTAAAAVAGVAAQAPVAFAVDAADDECSWIGEEPQFDEADIIDTVECEALVCGAGAGGMYAAAFLADLGVKPLVIELTSSNGGTFMFETALVKLEHDGQKVTGVIAETDDGYIRINAQKGVVVATGGYQGNPEAFGRMQPGTAIIVPDNGSLLNAHGGGLRACLWLGACMDDVHTSMLFDCPAIKPGEAAPDNVTSDYKSSKLGSQPFLKLNCFGDRFCNESQPYDYSLHMMANYPEHFFVDVFDSDYAKHIKQFELVGCSRYFPFPTDYEDYAASNDEIVDYIQNRLDKEIGQLTEEGYCVSADTIEELAELAQLPVDHVAAAAERYNEMCEAGEDTDFYKEQYRLTPVVKPPFYAVRFTGRMLTTIDGVHTDTDLHPVNKQGEPFENLYVTGNVSGFLRPHVPQPLHRPRRRPHSDLELAHRQPDRRDVSCGIARCI